MQMKVGKGVIPVLLLVSVLLLANDVSSASAANSSVWSIKPGQSAQWLVMDSTNVTAEWYLEDFTTRIGSYNVPVHSRINLTITSVLGTKCNANVSVGNLTRTNIPMSETAFNLALGFYPFQPGFVCPVNWDVQKQNATNNMFNNFTVEESKIGDIEMISFKYLSGTIGTPGTIGTILVYDKATGLLIHGYGYAYYGHEFMIEVALTSTNIDVGSVQSEYQTLGAGYVQIEVATMVGAIVVITAFILVTRRSASKK